MKELLDWVEKSAIENLKAHHASADVMAKDAATTLTVFLAALAGGLAYAAKAIEQNSFNWVAVGAIGFTAWFFVLSLVLVWKCLMVREIPGIYNEPRNIFQPGFAVEALREAEIESLQGRIDTAAASNAKVAKWMNWLRLAAAASPIIFIASAAVAWKVAA